MASQISMEYSKKNKVSANIMSRHNLCLLFIKIFKVDNEHHSLPKNGSIKDTNGMYIDS